MVEVVITVEPRLVLPVTVRLVEVMLPAPRFWKEDEAKTVLVVKTIATVLKAMSGVPVTEF